jgi:hypothetical protein
LNTSKHSSTIFTGLSFLLLLLLGMMGCGKSVAVDVEPQTTEVSEETTHVKEVDVGETDRINLTPSPETLTYTNQVYGFELEHPKTWSQQVIDQISVGRRAARSILGQDRYTCR